MSLICTLTFVCLVLAVFCWFRPLPTPLCVPRFHTYVGYLLRSSVRRPGRAFVEKRRFQI